MTKEYYLYNASGQRVRKITEDATGNIIAEKRYVGNVEVKRNGSGQTIEQILHLHSDGHATVNLRRPVDGDVQLRYQLGNHLGSVAVELAEQAEVLSYEEYLPYGGTALIAGNDQQQTALKEHRYSNKERDDTSSLCYYGARYYAPWLGRWLNPDPAGTVDGLNLYAFVRGNPMILRDIGGMISDERKQYWSDRISHLQARYREEDYHSATGIFQPISVPPLSPRLMPTHRTVPAPIDQIAAYVDKTGLIRQKIKGKRNADGTTPGIILVRDPTPRRLKPDWPNAMKGMGNAAQQRKNANENNPTILGGTSSHGHQLASRWYGPFEQWNAASATNDTHPGWYAQEAYQSIIENAIDGQNGLINQPKPREEGGTWQLSDFKLKHTAYL